MKYEARGIITPRLVAALGLSATSGAQPQYDE